MNYEEAKRNKEDLETATNYFSKQLQTYPKNELGMTPKHIRELEEYKILKNKYEESFRKLQNFNSWFIKAFKKEYQNERKNRYTKQ